MGLLIALIFFRIQPGGWPIPEPLPATLAIVLSTILIWEGNLQIDSWLNRSYPWVNYAGSRALLQVAFCLAFTTIGLLLLISGAHRIIDRGGPARPGSDPLFLPGICIAFAVLATDIGHQFLKAWKHSLVEVEKYKAESANAQLRDLKSQLSPHFLFNNLSVLSALVYADQDKAVDFIGELSKVYRYVAESNSAGLVPLQDELDFLSHYIYLLQIRFGNGVSFQINIDDRLKSFYLPPMCLQVLIENTIQHNEASQANPLQVMVFTRGYDLVIQNTVRLRTEGASGTATGLANIRSRYAFFTDRPVEVRNSGEMFTVVLPLITHR